MSQCGTSGRVIQLQKEGMIQYISVRHQWVSPLYDRKEGTIQYISVRYQWVFPLYNLYNRKERYSISLCDLLVGVSTLRQEGWKLAHLTVRRQWLSPSCLWHNVFIEQTVSCIKCQCVF